MRATTIITLLAAIVLGTMAAFLAKVWLEGQASPTRVVVQPSSQKSKPEITLQRIVVASQPLRFGNVLSDENLTEVEWPTGAVPAGAFTSKADLLKGDKKRSVLASIEKNEPVLKWKITGPGQRASLSALIDSDMKAVTIRVNDVKGVAGFILPGDRVDIFLTRAEKGDDGPSRQFTDIILENVKVLAVDQLADDRTEKPTLAKAVTVEVTTLGAQKLVLASSAGNLALVLRRAGATSAIGNRRVTLGDLSVPPTAPEKDVDTVEPPNTNSLISILRGTRREEVAVPKN